MMFGLSHKIKFLIDAFKTRVLGDSGVFEGEDCTHTQLTSIDNKGLLDSASLVITPNGYKTGKLYSVVPSDGSGDMDVTRATTATRVNEQGLIERVPYNLVTHSQDFNSWAAQNSSISANVALSPSGTMSADKLIPDITLNQHRILTTLNFIGLGTFSVYAKADGYNFLSLGFSGGVSGGSIYFNLSTGTITGTEGGFTANIENAGNGWFRCSVTHSNLGAGIAISYLIVARESATTANYVGNGTSGILLWGAQVVEGTEPKDYYPTTTGLNIPRIDYSNGSCPSILVEPQMTNLFTNNNSLLGYDSAVYAVKGSLVTDAFGSGFNGVNYTFTGGSGFVSADYTVRTIDTRTNSIQRLAIYIKNPSSDFLAINFGLVAQVNYKFSTLESSNSNGNIRKINTDTYVLYLYTDLAAMSQFSQVRIAFVTSLVSSTTIGGTATIGLAFHQQIASGTLPNSGYSAIPTVASAVTRNADNISKTGVSGLIGQTEGTIFLDFYYRNLAIDFLIFINNSLSNYLFRARVGSTGTNVFNSTYAPFGGGGAQTFSSSVTLTPFTRNKIAVVYDSVTNTTRTFANGVFIGQVNLTGAFATSQDKIDIGISFGTTPKDLNNVSLWTTKLTDQQAIALTTL
jgi:hypothetical protein